VEVLRDGVWSGWPALLAYRRADLLESIRDPK